MKKHAEAEREQMSEDDKEKLTENVSTGLFYQACMINFPHISKLPDLDTAHCQGRKESLEGIKKGARDYASDEVYICL